MRNVIALIGVLLMLSGCASMQGMFGGPSVCDAVEEGQSLICDKIGNPEALDKGLLLANYAAIREGAYNPDEAIKVLDEIEFIVQSGGITYAYLLGKITEILNANDAAAIILILSPDANKLNVALKINHFDQKLSLARLAHQRQLLTVLK